MTKTLPRQKANQILSYILWNRKFKPIKNITVMNGGKMSEEDYQKAIKEVELLTNKNI